MNELKLKSDLDQLTTRFVNNMDVVRLKDLSDQVIERFMLDFCEAIDGHAIAIWLPEQKNGSEVLTIALNIGDKGPEVEGVVSQPLDAGLVSKSFKEKQVICHQGFFKHREQSSSVDRKLGQITAHQIASPVQLFGVTIGAVTVIQTLGSGVENHSEWGFDDDKVRRFKAAVDVIQRLFELNVVRSIE